MKKPIAVLLHLGYWLMFLFLLVMFYVLILLNTRGAVPSLGYWMHLMLGFAIIPGVLSFYSFYFVWFNKFLKHKKIAKLFACGIVTAMLATVIGIALLALTFPWMNISNIKDYMLLAIIIGFGALINGVIGLVMRGFISWYNDIKLKEELNKKNYEMELALIKAQINPHFLFNTINNIDVLILKDPEKASAYLNKLSDIMRFMLYEAKTEKIPLRTELAYIDKYIDLQKIRNANVTYASYSVKGDARNLMIEPMLFIPFIENAFKHAESVRTGNAVKIDFVIDNDTITFDCRNKYFQDAQVKPEYSGLGNDLIKKRLSLLYPDKHHLDISEANDTYSVKLIIHPAE